MVARQAPACDAAFLPRSSVAPAVANLWKALPNGRGRFLKLSGLDLHRRRVLPNNGKFSQIHNSVTIRHQPDVSVNMKTIRWERRTTRIRGSSTLLITRQDCFFAPGPNVAARSLCLHLRTLSLCPPLLLSFSSLQSTHCHFYY